MKSFHDLIINRRSIRRYTDEKLAPEQVQTILEAGLMAPTSKNSRSWQFVCVDDLDMMARLADCKPAGAVSLKACPLAIVVCGDPAASEAWVEDASIAAAFMQLQATDLGLGSCWVQIRGRYASDGTPSEECVAQLLGIQEHYPRLCIVTI
ncbi:MAG: nitroreductase family protein, partial [Roseburia sp.]|nr:nitroreductase family protein [Roseburia sp.]